MSMDQQNWSIVLSRRLDRYRCLRYLLWLSGAVYVCVCRERGGGGGMA